MSNFRKIYLDHSATTPVDPRVVEAMMPYLTEKFGNASSVHFFGQEARAAVDRARREVAALIGARPNEVVFLSGGTEANNLAIRGLCEAAERHGRHIITAAIEHSSVRGICEALKQRAEHMHRLRDRFEAGVAERVEDIVFNGDRERRLPHLSNISFRFIEGEGLLISLDLQGIAVSTGSACSSGTLEPSPVIRALGRNDELARGSIRFSFGKDNVDADVDYAVEMTVRAVQSLRQLSPLSQHSAVV